VVSTAVGVITGRVLSCDRPVAGANVMLKRITGDGLRLFGGKLTTVTDAQGAFTVSAAPGNYFVIAWRTDDGPTALATAMEKAKREQGTGVTLSPSTRKEMDVRLP
jgi:carboxypeptidase family protein